MSLQCSSKEQPEPRIGQTEPAVRNLTSMSPNWMQVSLVGERSLVQNSVKVWDVTSQMRGTEVCTAEKDTREIVPASRNSQPPQAIRKQMAGYTEAHTAAGSQEI